MSWGYDATASLAPLNFNPAYSPAATNANLAALAQQQQAALSPQTLYGPGGFGAMTDYYSQLAANQLSALTPSTFAETPSSSSSDTNYGSLYGGGDAATPPSAYNYGSLYGGGGGGGGSGGGFGGLGGGGGGQATPFPSMAMPGGLDQSMALPSTGYDYGSLYGGGGGASNLGSRLAQALVGGDGGGGPFQSAFGAPSIGTSPGMAPNFGGFDNFGGGGPSAYDNTSLYGSGGAATPPSAYGYGGLGGGVYDPFNVGGQLDPALYGPGGLGGGSGIGQAPAAMPDLMRLLGYTPRQLSALPDRSGIDFRTSDVQGGIDSLQQTLDLIDRTTGGGYTLSPQDRDIPFRGPGGRSAGASPYADEDPYAGSGLPPEITQGGSIPNADPYPGFARSLFGDAPAYPSGVVRGPYELPDLTPQQAQDPFSGGGPLPYADQNPFANLGLPPEITQGFSSGRSAFNFDPSAFDQGFGNPRGFGGDPTFGFGQGFGGADFDPQTFQSPANDYTTFQQGPDRPLGVSPDIAKYYLQDPRMNANQRAAFEAFPGRFTPEDQQRMLQDDRAALAAQLENDPDAMRRFAAMAKSELGNVSDEQILAFLETPFNKYASKGWDAFQTGITTGRGLASPLADPGTPGSYYEPARPNENATLQTSLDAMRDNPALLAKYTDLIRQAMYGGTNLSGIATENASIGVAMGPDGYPMITGTGPRDMGGKALATQTLGGWAPDVPGGMEVFTRKDLPHAVHGGPGTRPLADWAYARSPWQNFSDWYNTTNPAQNVPWEQTWRR